MTRKRTRTFSAKTLKFTSGMSGPRHVIYLDGITATITESCWQALIRLARARMAGDGRLVTEDINAAGRGVPSYIWRWEQELSDFDARLKGVKLFEAVGHCHYRLTVDHIEGLDELLGVAKETQKG